MHIESLTCSQNPFFTRFSIHLHLIHPCSLFSSCLSGCSSSFSFMSPSLSPWLPRAGEPQRSVLGPTFYIPLIDDLTWFHSFNVTSRQISSQLVSLAWNSPRKFQLMDPTVHSVSPCGYLQDISKSACQEWSSCSSPNLLFPIWANSSSSLLSSQARKLEVIPDSSFSLSWCILCIWKIDPTHLLFATPGLPLLPLALKVQWFLTGLPTLPSESSAHQSEVRGEWGPASNTTRRDTEKLRRQDK